jgi:hypothetical protein
MQNVNGGAADGTLSSSVLQEPWVGDAAGAQARATSDHVGGCVVGMGTLGVHMPFPAGMVPPTRKNVAQLGERVHDIPARDAALPH